MPNFIKNIDPEVMCDADHSKAEAESDQYRDKANVKITKIVTANDVLPGRGKQVYGHHGNRIFLSLVKDNELKHSSSSNNLRKEQAKIIFMTMRNLDPPGRFLKFYAKADVEEMWQEMSEKEALTKIRQAMRDNTRRIHSNMQRSTFIFDASTQLFMNHMKFHSNCVGNSSSYSMTQYRGLYKPERNVPFVHQTNRRIPLFPSYYASCLQFVKSQNMYNSTNLNPLIGTVTNALNAKASMTPLINQKNLDTREYSAYCQAQRNKFLYPQDLPNK